MSKNTELVFRPVRGEQESNEALRERVETAFNRAQLEPPVLIQTSPEGGADAVGNLDPYFYLRVEGVQDVSSILARLSEENLTVGHAEAMRDVQSRSPLPPQSSAADDVSQDYLDGPGGLAYSQLAEKLPDLAGAERRLFVIGRGWQAHDALPSVQNLEIATEATLALPDKEDLNHGNGMLGVLVGKTNNLTGLCPHRKTYFASYGDVGKETDSNLNRTNIYQVVRRVVDRAQAGDVAIIAVDAVKLEGISADEYGHVTALGERSGRVGLEGWTFMRKEFRRAARKKVYVVLSAGNGGDPGGRLLDGFCRQMSYPSGALVVGAGLPYERRPEELSTTGLRVDVHSWGRGVGTCRSENGYQKDFSGTSAASAIVGGAVASLASYAEHRSAEWGVEPVVPPNLIWELLRQTGYWWTSGIGPRLHLGRAVQRLEELKGDLTRLDGPWASWPWP